MAAERSPCSVVLEGGVTSAVVYAGLLARLSRRYAFRQLGGTSSGAVAAAAAAAAEYQRIHAAGQPRSGFDTLAAFPNVLAQTDHRGQTVLYRLFQPKPSGLASFGVAMAALFRSEHDTVGSSVRRVALSLAQQFSVAALLLGLTAAGLAAIVADWLSSSLGCGPSIDRLLVCLCLGTLTMLPVVLGLWLILALWALWRTVGALRENHWGLCNGMDQPDSNSKALTPQLHELLQTLAGLRAKELLTFGRLWWGPPVDGKYEKKDERLIDLQVITTAVGLQRPLRLPGAPDQNPLHEFFYDPKEWQQLFPVEVVAHLQAHARPIRLQREGRAELWPLPSPEHWPVLLAVRLSLSFPLLLSAVPLYVAVPRREVLRGEAAAGQLPFEARRVYFSDGGITSNCPVHLFDAPLPRFPTFGVNLYSLPRGVARRETRSDTRDPELEAPRESENLPAATPLPFLLDILSTALNWRDSLQRRLPGYRERMVHIGLPPQAGGLHLAMSRDTIRRLAGRGICAAKRLERDFGTPRVAGEANAWERHRWTRARSSLTALRQHLNAFVSRLDDGSPRYRDLLRTSTPAEHAFDGEVAREQAIELARRADELVKSLDAARPDGAMDNDAPEPRPELRISPPW